MQNTQQRLDLTLSLGLQGLQLVRKIHPGGGVRHAYQYMADLPVHPHPMEIELQVACIEFPVAAVQVHLHLTQGIDGLDEIFVGALRPQDLDELECGREGPLRDHVFQQIFETKPGEVLAMEKRFQCPRISRTDHQLAVQQE